jgi:hypothetical protein
MSAAWLKVESSSCGWCPRRLCSATIQASNTEYSRDVATPLQTRNRMREKGFGVVVWGVAAPANAAEDENAHVGTVLRDAAHGVEHAIPAAATHHAAALCGAGLCGAGLCGAGLCGAGLCGAGLCGAGLCGAGARAGSQEGSALAAEFVCQRAEEGAEEAGGEKAGDEETTARGLVVAVALVNGAHEYTLQPIGADNERVPAQSVTKI